MYQSPAHLRSLSEQWNNSSGIQSSTSRLRTRGSAGARARDVLEGESGGRRPRSAISGYGAHAEAGSCRITMGLHLLEVTRCCSAYSSCCFNVGIVSGGALRLRECAWVLDRWESRKGE